MTRLLVCLGFCVLFAVCYRQTSTAPQDADVTEQPVPAEPLRPEWLHFLAGLPQPGMPAQLPWAGLVQLGEGSAAAADHLPTPDPVAFLDMCLERCAREVRGASLTLFKQERVGGTLQPPEVVEAHYTVEPLQVFLKWHKGARRADAVLYAVGKYDNQMLALPSGVLRLVGVVEKALDSPESKQSGRYTIDHFGLGKMMERTRNNWKNAQERGALHVDYLGVYRVAEAGHRLCYKLHRSRYEQPEEDGVTDALVYIDTETWLQVGSVVRNEKGLIAEYFFRDIRLNPTFTTNQFDRSALK